MPLLRAADADVSIRCRHSHAAADIYMPPLRYASLLTPDAACSSIFATLYAPRRAALPFSCQLIYAYRVMPARAAAGYVVTLLLFDVSPYAYRPICHAALRYAR